MRDKTAVPLGILVLRLSLGFLFISHLYWKFFLLDGGVGRWWSLLDAAGYPSIVPIYALTAEFIGAIFITAGLFTRWVSLYTLPFMLGSAHFWAERKGFYFTDAGAELPIVWALMLAAQSLLGDGAYSLAALRKSRDGAPRSTTLNSHP